MSLKARLRLMKRRVSTCRCRSAIRSWAPPGSLGYYPRYQGLWPTQRAKYLAWLASGLTEPLDDIGYAFLYFYGLERRLLLDRADLSPIVKEVVRLLETYTESPIVRWLSQPISRVRAGQGRDRDTQGEVVPGGFREDSARRMSNIWQWGWPGFRPGSVLCPPPGL